METRELKTIELDDLLALYAHLHDRDDPLPERKCVEDVWNNIRNHSSFRYYGVFVDRRLVSSCTLSVIPNLTRGCRPYGLIENVVTHSEFRRRGYAAAALKYTLSRAWRERCYKVMLLTGRKNEGIFSFYESVGFDRDAKQAFLAKPRDPGCSDA